MGNKGQTQTSTYNLPEWENQDWQNLISKADTQTNQDIQSINYPQLLNQIQGSSQGILSQQVNPDQLSSGIVAAGNKSFTDPGVASSYMSPYEDTALKSQVNLDRSALLDPELAQTDRAAAASGALGGSRNALERSQIVNNFNNTEANQIAQGENAAYQTGQNAFETDAARALQGETAGAQTNLAGRNSNVYTNYAATQNSLQGVAASEAPGQQLATEAGILSALPRQGTQQTVTSPNGGAFGGIMSGILGAAGTLLKGVHLKKGGIVAAPAKKSRKRRKK